MLLNFFGRILSELFLIMDYVFLQCIFSILVAAASAGYLGAPYGLHAPAVVAAHAPVAYAAPAPVAYAAPAPVAYAAPVVKAVAPVATSYANTYKVSVRAPVAYAAPVAAVHAAPAVVAAPAYHAPLGIGYAHGYLH